MQFFEGMELDMNAIAMRQKKLCPIEDGYRHAERSSYAPAPVSIGKSG
ncbi:hypothetical protein [Leptolyngbya ohadii]|nr:hypothetical protein [Leptolyngbya ohadii]